MLKTKIYVAGHKGMVGSALIRVLKKKGFNNIITRTHKQLDLINQYKVQSFFQKEKPSQVYIAAAKVGGIYPNSIYPADFIYNNLMIQSNIINSAFKNGVKKLLFLGSSCIYPKYAKQPMQEKELLTGLLEPSNEPYAIAKIAGIKLCESYNRQYGKSHKLDYRSLMPTNLYGTGDNYHPKDSHVIPALIRRFHEGKIKKKNYVTIWGSGKPLREFLHVDDMAKACVYIMSLDKEKYEKHIKKMCSHVNLGSGNEISIKQLAKILKEIVNYKGKILFDKSKPDGSPRKLMSNKLIKTLGWKPEIELKNGLKMVYSDFKKIYEKL